MRPKPRTQVVEVKAPPPPAPSAQYVAVLQKDGGAPAFILTVDGATKNFTVRKVGAAAEPGKSFELWLISDKLPTAALAGRDRRQRLHRASGAGVATMPTSINAATYAVTVEQAGGSPDGKPTFGAGLCRQADRDRAAARCRAVARPLNLASAYSARAFPD